MGSPCLTIDRILGQRLCHDATAAMVTQDRASEVPVASKTYSRASPTTGWASITTGGG